MTAAVAGAAAGRPGLLSGGAELRSAVTEQRPAGEERLSLLGRLFGNLIWNLRPNNMEEADNAFG